MANIIKFEKKLNVRLKTLINMVIVAHRHQQYEHIYDVCCDHGYIGLSLFHPCENATIHFIDNVPAITQQLADYLHKVNDKRLSLNRYETTCMDAKDIKLPNFKKHLVILAGIGGDLLVEILSAIQQNNALTNTDFLLCPVHKTYKLRQFLIKGNFYLKDEILVKDNKRFYEILHISKDSNYALVDEVGSNKLWYSIDAHQYQEQLINYYTKVLKGYLKKQNPEKATQIQGILNSYKNISF